MPTETPTITPSRRLLLWALPLGYVIFIYATLGVAPQPLAYLRAHGVLRLTLAALFTLCWIGIFGLLVSRSRQLWRFIALLLVIAVYVWVARGVVSPEEKVHFVQYGLVGVFFVRALRPSVRHEGIAYTIALALAIGAGWLDEILQGQLPNRHYDVRDIFLNAISAFLGLVVHRLVPRKNER